MSDRHREFGAIGSFVARASRNDLVDVLILPFVDEPLEVSLAEKTHVGRIAVIEDQAALLSHSQDLEKRLRFAKPRRTASEFLSHAFSFSVVPEGMPGSFRYGIFDWMGSSEAQLAPLYVIRRNRVLDATLSRFLRAFRSVPPLRRPKVVLDAEGSVQEARSLLRLSRDSVMAFFPGRDGIQSTGIEVRGIDIDRFPEAILSGAVSACASVEMEPPAPDAPPAERRRYAVFLYQRIQANKGCDRRFEAAADIDLLESFVRSQLAGTLDEPDRLWFAEALIFALLDRSYVEEGPRQIEYALGIAQALGDPDLEAWVLRHINISAGVTAFASQRLEHAAQVLQRAGRFTQAAYAATNRIITDIHRSDAPIDVGRAESVVDYVLDWAPYCERLSSIINGAGVAALIAGNLYRAEELFRRAADANGGRLHRLSAQVNLRIAQHIGGARHKVEEIESIFRAILTSKMSKKLDYHHVYLIANLIGLTRSKSLKAKLRAHLLEASYLDYDFDTVVNDNLIPYLATKFTKISDGHRFRGKRGQFTEEYGLLPLAQFIWN
ncbi:MAG: hypothetical protein QOG72_2158 [Sphingomonadales bacterium]|jgi:hypothetical protein|nr:hypothetical protein [Sphingomonadales bacterium]